MYLFVLLLKKIATAKPAGGLTNIPKKTCRNLPNGKIKFYRSD